MIPFIGIGDFGSGYKEQYLVSKLIEKFKIDFVCGLGDNIYNEGVSSVNDKQFYTKFEKPYSNLSNKIKWYMCIGNHDYGNKLYRMMSKRPLYQIEYSKKSELNDGKWVLPNLYYHYQKRKNNILIDFIVLDTNINYMKQSDINKQIRFVKNKLNQCNGDWIIVYGHHPWRSTGSHGNSNGDHNLELFFKNIFSNVQPDLYMAGHDHSKQVIIKKYKNKDIHLIVSGAGGKSNLGEEFNLNNMNDCDLLYCSNNLGIIYFKCNKNFINILSYDFNNLLEFSYKLNKKNI
jgi:tartrate-resistant acid phosphatase type 5